MTDKKQVAKNGVAGTAKGQKAKKQSMGRAADCGSLLPPRWSVLYMFYEHGDVLMREGACQEDLQVDQFLTGKKAAEGEFNGGFQELLGEMQSGSCRAYLPPRFFRFEYYELDKWGQYVRETLALDSQSLAKVLCGAAKTLTLSHRPKKGGPIYHHFVLVENPGAYAERLAYRALAETVNTLQSERKRLPPDVTMALKRLYLSRIHELGVVYEVVVAKEGNRSNLKAVERLPLYNLARYPQLREALERSAKYLREEDAYKIAVEVAESLEAHFETCRVEHLYDALRVLHGVANRENCDASCWYARVLLPGVREVVERGPC